MKLLIISLCSTKNPFCTVFCCCKFFVWKSTLYFPIKYSINVSAKVTIDWKGASKKKDIAKYKRGKRKQNTALRLYNEAVLYYTQKGIILHVPFTLLLVPLAIPFTVFVTEMLIRRRILRMRLILMSLFLRGLHIFDFF